VENRDIIDLEILEQVFFVVPFGLTSEARPAPPTRFARLPASRRC
jgi:hypothetical protein